jgi:predicted secreted protein
MSWVGRRLIIRKDGVAIAGARAKSVRFNNDPIDVTYEEEDGFRHFLDVLDTREVVIGIDGVLSAPHVEQLIRPKIEGELIDVEIEFPDESTLSADGAYIQSLQITGEYRNAVTFSASLVLSGPLVRRCSEENLDWVYRQFKDDGSFVVPDYVPWVETVVVAGGGSAGSLISGTQTSGSGGGGGGGVRAERVAVTPGSTVAVTVGQGGTWTTGATDAALAARKGKNSSFGSLVAEGGGTSQSHFGSGLQNDLFPATAGQSGGSGGGCAGGFSGGGAGGTCGGMFEMSVGDPSIRNGGSGSSGQDGGSWVDPGDCTKSGGGGGGAKTPGVSISPSTPLGHGGDGYTLPELGWPDSSDFVRDRGIWNQGVDTSGYLVGDKVTRTMVTSGPSYSFVALRPSAFSGVGTADPRDTTFGVADPHWRLALDAVGGGGGGGSTVDPGGAQGGIGGGANGRFNAGTAPGQNLLGGGAGGMTTGGNNGGDGVVLVRYPTEESLNDCTREP